MENINCKKKKGEAMPYQCEICENFKAVPKVNRDINDYKNNKCHRCYDDDTSIQYKPFTNSKKEITLTCRNFAHIRELRVK